MNTRRTFLEKAGAIAGFALVRQCAGAASFAEGLGNVTPMRQDTRNGQMVTSFSLGGWHVGLFNEGPKQRNS